MQAMEPNETQVLNAAAVCDALAKYRIASATEDEMQTCVARALEAEQIGFRREVRNGPDRIDFLVCRVGIECKVDGSVSKVTRQLYRYSLWESIDELVCVSSQGRHALLPKALSGKPVRVHIVRGVF